MEHQTKLQPECVFHYFAEVCKIPRPSKKEEKMIAFLKDFGEKHGLETKVDKAGNVLIKKPATPGFENRKTVILQSHIDMVCEKNKETQHDFEKDPIETYVDGEWLRAKGTTLGADNGIGVATELAILAADDVKHGPIECLFTVDEETGLTGAFALEKGFMDGDILLNLDSEDEGELFIGCAGGVRTLVEFDYQPVTVPADFFCFRLAVEGLTGGHSGDDINKMRANANKLLGRFLYQTNRKYDFYLLDIDGGNLHNAIPREAHALCAIPMGHKEDIRVDWNIFAAEVEEEYAATEKNMKFKLDSETYHAEAIERQVVTRFLAAVQGVFNGVFAMSQDIPGLVETSSNLASIKVRDHKVIVTSSQRSSILSARKNVADSIQSVFELAGARVDVGEGYPGWKPNTQSEILQIAVDTYKELFGVEPKVKAIHAGLECGLFLEKYPSLDMVSFGPTLRGVHSPDERMLIPTVDKFWRHLLAVLQRIPLKA